MRHNTFRGLATPALPEGRSSRQTDILDRPDALDHLMNPGSIAVVGASKDRSKPGGKIVLNIKEHGFKGDLWAVNPKGMPINGIPVFTRIEDLPGSPDLGIISVPKPLVRESLEALAAKGVRAVILLASGFGEVDARGKAEEIELVKIADRAGITLVGPNTLGVLSPAYAGIFAGPVYAGEVQPGAVDFISGSGATANFVRELSWSRGLHLSHMVTVGNSAQQGVEDILALFDHWNGSGAAPVFMLYLEQLKKPGKFLAHARSLVGKGHRIVAVKGGSTDAGNRAASSHSGALASSERAIQALFEKAGIIRVRSKREMVDVAAALTVLKNKAVSRICIITDSGGPGVLLTDELARQGLAVPVLKETTRKLLVEVLNPGASVFNPVDCLATRTPEQIRKVFEILCRLEKDRIDAIVIITGDNGLGSMWDIYEEIITAMDRFPIPVIPVLPTMVMSAAEQERLRAAGKCFFHDEVNLGKALGKIARWTAPTDPVGVLAGYAPEEIRRIAKGLHGQLSPEIVSALLRAAGFKVTPCVTVRSRHDLITACEKIGYPLAMKVIGPIHKTDKGGVRLWITNPEGARAAWRDLLRIPGAEGVLVQPMIQGAEVILGASRHGDFGHLILFGMGGIYAEVLGDLRFALAPLSLDDSMRLIRGIRGFPILEGMRGKPGMNIELLSDCLLRLSLLVSDFPEIREIDLNPLKGRGSDLTVVDARIIVGWDH